MITNAVTPGTGIQVAACLASTLDGRLAHPEIAVLGSDHDRRRLEGLRAQADVLLYGAGTARADSRRQIEFRFPEIGRPVQSRLGLPVPPIVVLCRSATFDFSGPFWSTPTPKLLLHARPLPVGSSAPAGFEPLDDVLPDDVDYLPIPSVVNLFQPHDGLHVSMGVVLASVAQWLAEAAPLSDGTPAGPGTDRPTRVLCEGGGAIVAALMGDELLDELFLTVTSWVAGDDKDAPLSVGGITGPQRFILQSANVVTATSEVFLRYRREGRAPWPITEQY